MKKFMKVLTLIMIVMMIISASSMVFAAVDSTFDPSTYTGTGSVATTELDDVAQNVIKVITTIGSVVSVIVLIVLGIKYMIGSTEEKAEYKKTLMPYVIGAFLVFAASTLASMVFNFVNI